MKQCPTCQSQYTDDTLQFCLQDGAPLQFIPGSQSKTIAYGSEPETVVANRPSNQIRTPHVTNPTDWNPQQFSSNPAFQPPATKSNTPVAVFLTAFVMLLLFGLVGIGLWLFFKGPRPDDDKGNLFLAKRTTPSYENGNRASNSMPVDTSKPTPPVKATALPENANAVTSTTPVDQEQIRRDVSQKVGSWKSAAEARNLDDYMSNYAGTVDYYNKKGASAATVRADKARAFTSFDSIKITLGNIAVTPDAGGETATAVFDKEWAFSGAKYSAGKVQWLITGERDLKVYYTQ
jgi:hypothetical protein